MTSGGRFARSTMLSRSRVGADGDLTDDVLRVVRQHPIEEQHGRAVRNQLFEGRRVFLRAQLRRSLGQLRR